MAGKGWLYFVLCTNSKLSLRNPEATSMARAKGFNCGAVTKSFDLFEMSYRKI